MNPNSFVWQPLPASAPYFAIESDSPHALESARRLFAPWIIEDSERVADAAIARRWRIEERGENRYAISTDNSSHVAGADAFSDGEHGIIEQLTQIEYASLAHLVAHLPPEFIGLHGALLSRECHGAQRAVILVGPKEAGKSTLACALWRAGWRLHCDDYTLLDGRTDGRGYAQPTARRVSLRNGSREILGEELWQSALRAPSTRVAPTGILFHPHEIEGRECERAAPIQVGAICFLKRREIETAPAQSSPIVGIEAAFALLPYSSLLLEAGTLEFASQSENWSAQLIQIADLLSQTKTPLYDLGRGLPADMIREVERLVRPQA